MDPAVRITSDRNGSGARRIGELDALRALAAINLMLFHFTHVYSVKYGFTTPLGFEFPWGKYGVQLFFMLSGLVNAMALLGKRDASGFLASRAWRILPLFFFAMLVNVLLLGIAPLSGREWSWAEIAANLTLMPNLFGVDCLEPVLWTLQVEVIFYGWLVLAWRMGWLEKPLRPALAVLAGCLVLCPVLDRMELIWPAGGMATGLSFARQLLLVDYWPLFVVGIVLQRAWTEWNGRTTTGNSGRDSRTASPGFSWSVSGIRNHLARVVAALKTGKADSGAPGLAGIRNHLAVVAGALVVFHVTDRQAHNPLVSLLLTGLLAGAVAGWLPVLRWKPLLWISAISYPLYLLHDNLGSVAIWWLNRELGWSPRACCVLALVLAVGLAWVATHGVERPLVKGLRTRLGARPAEGLPRPVRSVWEAAP
jgi:peptidoglycan/LPS O-acetylase OafA/YrhL